MGIMSDLDIFISQHCKDNKIEYGRIVFEICDHFDGAPFESLSQDSKDILDAWTVYCNEIDKRIIG